MAVRTAVRVDTSVIDVVAFRIGARHFGLPVAQVNQVFPVVEITPLDGAPEPVCGCVTIAGARLPVVDLRRRVEGVWSAPRLQQRLILVRAETRSYALLADDVDGVIHLSPTALAAAEAPTYDGFIYTSMCDVADLLSAAEEAQLAAALERCPA